VPWHLLHMSSAPSAGCSKDAIALKEAGNVAFTAGRYKEAAEYFSEAILRDPTSALLRSNRAGALASMHRHEDALADADMAIKLQPDWWKGHTRRAHALFHLKRYPEAEETFRHALKLNPGERSVMEGLEKVRQAIENPPKDDLRGAGSAPSAPSAPVLVQPAPAGAWSGGAWSGGAAASTAGPPGGATASTAGPPGSSGQGFADRPADFQKLSDEELKRRLVEAASKLSDQQLDAELRAAGIYVPAGASREQKVKLYVQTPEDLKPKDVKDKSNLVARNIRRMLGAGSGKTTGDKMLERRKKWVEEWATWDNPQMVSRLAKLGIDGDGLNRQELLEELLAAETERYHTRCNPEKMQKYGLVGVFGLIVLTFGGVVLILFVAS